MIPLERERVDAGIDLLRLAWRESATALDCALLAALEQALGRLAVARASCT